jgi:carbon-monoxide dehydrogenase large subunit
MLAAQAEGATITTIEGVAAGDHLSTVQQAFWEHFAVQDGYTTPGTVLAAMDLLAHNPSPSDAEIRDWLDGNLDRSTGYHNVVQAISAAAATLQTTGLPAGDAPIPAAAVRTKEAPAMLRGETRYVADITMPGMLHAAILRSAYGHALLTRIDTAAARAMPGVVGVFTGEDTAEIMPMPVIWVPQDIETHFPPHPSGQVPGSQPVLARDRVRFVGELVAVVVAETPRQAHDALAAIVVDYEPLPAVVDAEDALKDGAPQLHETVPHNLVLRGSYGDRARTEQAIAASEVVVRQRLRSQRMMAQTIETRGSIGSYDPATGDYTLWTNVQPLYPVRLLISQYVLGIPFNKLRVIAPAIGGSNGSKGFLFADAPLVLWLARKLGRPVKWVDTREGLALSTPHGRAHFDDVTLAGSRDGTITALLCSGYSDIGAYPLINAPSQPRTLIGRSITGPYAIEHPYYEVAVALTNTVPVGSLRGSGRAEATYMIERMIDLFAREIGKDPAEVRRKNLVRPDQLPYDNKLGWQYDSGDYPAALATALEAIDYPHAAARKAEARTRGKRRGVGIGSYVVVAGVGPSAKMGKEGLVSGTWGSAHVGVHPTGEVVVTTGAQPHGQAQETTLAQIVSAELGVPLPMIRVRHSDTDGPLIYGQGSYGSRSLSVEGSAVYLATQKIKEKARQLAAHLFKAPLEGIVYDAHAGTVFLQAAPAQAVMALQQIAFVAWLAWDLPDGMDPALEAVAYFNPVEFNYPFGTHVAEVEIDEQTGQVRLVRYVAVDDCGTVINAGVVDGQTHGNIALGMGQALLEEVIFDADGQLVTRDLATYAIPRAAQLPDLELFRTFTPTPTNPLGAKGAGDVNNPPVAPAIANAVCDALSDLGIRHLDTPLTPEKVWRAMQRATVTDAEARG